MTVSYSLVRSTFRYFRQPQSTVREVYKSCTIELCSINVNAAKSSYWWFSHRRWDRLATPACLSSFTKSIHVGIIIIIIYSFGIYSAAVVPDSGVGNTWQRLTLVLILDKLLLSILQMVLALLAKAFSISTPSIWNSVSYIVDLQRISTVLGVF